MSRLTIRQVRKLLGMDQKQFAERINVSRTILSQWENGRHVPNKSNQEAITDLVRKASATAEVDFTEWI